jgi:RNA recognition motif-containing protein
VRPAFTLTPGCIELYVGNLSYDVKDELLFKEFSAFGKVNTARVIMNNFNGKSKGFAFVEMMDRAEAQKAIDAMNGKELLGRAIRVNEARNVGKLLKD